jgi:hypothetical protein
MATINDIRRNGTQDEKDWAVALLTSCVHIFSKPVSPVEDVTAPDYAVPASSPDDAVTSGQRKQASEELARRCRGVKDLSVADRQALRQELLAGADSNSSALGRLHAISDDRWNAEQAKLISDSLYSGDPVLARAAFYALLAAFDSNAPGGAERQTAFMMALGHEYTGQPLSEFERLQGCRSLGWCGSNWGLKDQPTKDDPTVDRLADAYRAAVASRMDARSILAIR